MILIAPLAAREGKETVSKNTETDKSMVQISKNHELVCIHVIAPLTKQPLEPN